jgi:serine protease Do
MRPSHAIVVLALLAMSASRPDLAAADRSASEIFREAREYTVRVRTTIVTPFVNDEPGTYEGAGFLVDLQRRWVLTNAHVASESPSEVEVAFADEDYVPAKKVYVDSFTDVAVLELPSGKLPKRVARLACSTVPVVGEEICAYGHPLGLPFTGSRGIVSGHTSTQDQDLVQIDATIDPGNSGGPVIRLSDGAVVGIATSKFTGDKADELNFATPIKDVCRILELLRRGIDPSPPRLEFNLAMDEDGQHTMWTAISSEEERWPLRPGDRILSIGEERVPVTTLTDLVSALRGRTGEVPVEIERGGGREIVRVRPQFRGSLTDRRGVRIDGALFAVAELDSPKEIGSPLVLAIHSVEPGSEAEAHGLTDGDFLVQLDGRRFDDIGSMYAYVKGRETKDAISLVLRRGSTLSRRVFEYHVRRLSGSEILPIGAFDGAEEPHASR